MLQENRNRVGAVVTRKQKWSGGCRYKEANLGDRGSYKKTEMEWGCCYKKTEMGWEV